MKEERDRARELRDKEKSGELSDAEKEELAKIKEAIEARRAELRAKHKEHIERHRAEQSPEKLRERRREARRAFLKKYGKIHSRREVNTELGMHARRMARLERAKYLATIEERVQLLETIDELVEREQARHEKRMTQLQEKSP
jgi:hypothetical protein